MKHIKPVVASFLPYFFMCAMLQAPWWGFVCGLPFVLSFLCARFYARTGRGIHALAAMYEGSLFLFPYFLFFMRVNLLLFAAFLPLVMASYGRRALHKRGKMLSVLDFFYACALFAMVFFSVTLPLFLKPAVFIVVVLLLLPLVVKRWVIFPFACAVLIAIGIHVTSMEYDMSRANTGKAARRLGYEPHVRLFLPLKTYSGRGGLSVRSVFFDKTENYLYFTTTYPFLNQKVKLRPALAQVSLSTGRTKTLSDFYVTNLCFEENGGIFYGFVPDTKVLLKVQQTPFRLLERYPLKTPYHFLSCFYHAEKKSIHLFPESGTAGVFSAGGRKLKMDKKQSIHSYSGAYVHDKKNKKLYHVTYGMPYYVYEWDYGKQGMTRKKRLGFWGGAWSIAYNKKKDVFYIPAFFTGKIYVVFRGDLKVKKVFSLKPGLRAVCFDEKRRLLYAGSLFDEYLTILDEDGKAIGKVFVGKGARSIALSPKTNRLYVGNAVGIVEVKVDGWLNRQSTRAMKRMRDDASGN